MFTFTPSTTRPINAPPLADKISTNRTSSLLSPIFGRFPFGRREKESEGARGELRLNGSDYGKATSEKSSGIEKQDFQATKIKSRSTFLSRRISTPTPSTLRSPPLRRTSKSNSPLHNYSTFSKSSPDLHQDAELYQPWPRGLNITGMEGDGLELEVENSKVSLQTRDISQSPPDLTFLPKNNLEWSREEVESQVDNEYDPSAFSSPNSSNSPPSAFTPSPPSIRDNRRSMSPELSAAAIKISRSLTLAKLESIESSIPFPTRIPAPTRSPPPTPLERNFSNRRRTYVKSTHSNQAGIESVESGINLVGNSRPVRPRSQSSHQSSTKSVLATSAAIPNPPPLRIPTSNISTGFDSRSEDTPDDSQVGQGSTLFDDSPLSTEINLKGRAIRVKNGQNAELVDFNDRNWTNSSDTSSSTFTDYSFRGGQSFESNSIVKDGRNSVEYTGSGTVSFKVDRTREKDRDKSWSELGRNKIYGDKKNSESAVDVMTVVEEDETPGGAQRAKALSRHSQPGFIISPTPLSPTPRSRARHNSEVTPSLWVDSSSPKPASRKHRLSNPRNVSLGRSLSTSAATPNLSEREERGPFSAQLEFARNNFHSPPPSPSSLLPSFGSKNHNRWSSEINSIAGTKDSEKDNLQNSFAKDGRNSGNGSRTILILLEDNRPTMTYQLGECIGKGQFGSVYRALNMNSGRVVAVKRIKVQGKTEEEVLQLSNEVEMLKTLAHPGVVKYEGQVRTQHFVNIILEYVENGSLQKTLKHFGELPESLVASYVVKILEGLAYLHSKRVVHCDLKCANILSTKNGNIKLSDFGVSLNLNAAQHLNNDVDVNGTPNWMAPEVIQLRGASTASDIWSLGCTIVELVTGRPPYSELLPMSAMFRIVEDVRPPIPTRASPELADFLTQCFRKDPLERPTAEALFDHDWLNKNWDRVKDLRPQDSIPFLRRISTNVRAGAAVSIHSRNLPPNMDRIDSVTSPTLSEFLSSSQSTSVSSKKHSLVKITFSKAVECKLCHDFVKRQAVLCEECGLIAHTRCSEFATGCDRAQLLSPILPRTPLAPISNANTFFNDLNPFRAKRLKTTLSLQISPRAKGDSFSPPNSPPLSKVNPRRQLSELVTRNRSRSTVSIPRPQERRSESTGSAGSGDGQRDSMKSNSARSFGLESIEEPPNSPSKITTKLQKRKSRSPSEESCIVS